MSALETQLPVLTVQARREDRDRTQAIHDMLTRYEQARSESSSPGGSGGRHESRLLEFDHQTWTSAYRELDRCLERLRYIAQHGRPMIERGVSSSTAWWHLRHRYLHADVVRREVHSRRTHSGERVPVALPANMEIVARQTILNGKSSSMLVRVWDRRVDPKIVAAGLGWIAGQYRGMPAVYSETTA